VTDGIGETDGVGEGVGTSKDEVFMKAASKPTGSSILTVFASYLMKSVFIFLVCSDELKKLFDVVNGREEEKRGKRR
jgi:hypothetical protein